MTLKGSGNKVRSGICFISKANQSDYQLVNSAIPGHEGYQSSKLKYLCAINKNLIDFVRDLCSMLRPVNFNYNVTTRCNSI